MSARATGVPGTPVQSRLWYHVFNVYRQVPFYWEIDRVLVRWTGFSIITLLWSLQHDNDRLPSLLLETIGRTSGEIRPNVLPYFVHREDLVIIGSIGGGPRDPQWVKNLRAEPRCWLVRRNHRVPAVARVVTGDEKERMISHGVWHKTLDYYESRAGSFGRTIPFVVLSPRRQRPKGKRRRNDAARYNR